MIDLLVLGSGAAVPQPGRAPAGYWLELDGRGVLLDPGPGALARLVSSPHGPDGVDGIDTVLLSHLHPDHCADLLALLFALHSILPTETRPLRIAGPRGLDRYLDRLRELYGDWVVPRRRAIATTELAPGDRLDLGGGDAGEGPDVRAFAAVHGEDRFSEDNLCLRFRCGRGYTLCYSGDSEPGPGLLDAARGADLLLVECSTPDELATPGHMTPSRVGDLCREAAPGRVVLTHLYPPAAALDLPALVGMRFRGPVVVAEDGARYTLP